MLDRGIKSLGISLSRQEALESSGKGAGSTSRELFVSDVVMSTNQTSVRALDQLLRRLFQHKPSPLITQSVLGYLEGSIAGQAKEFSDFAASLSELFYNYESDRLRARELAHSIPITLSDQEATAQIATGVADGAVFVTIKYTPAKRGFFSSRPALLQCQLFVGGRPAGQPANLQLSEAGKPNLPATPYRGNTQAGSFSSGAVIERTHEFLEHLIVLALHESGVKNSGLLEADLNRNFKEQLVQKVTQMTHMGILPHYFASSIVHEGQIAGLQAVCARMQSFLNEWQELTTGARATLSNALKNAVSDLEKGYVPGGEISLESSSLAVANDSVSNSGPTGRGAAGSALMTALPDDPATDLTELKMSLSEISGILCNQRDSSKQDKSQTDVQFVIATKVQQILTLQGVTNESYFTKTSDELCAMIRRQAKESRLTLAQLLLLLDVFLSESSDAPTKKQSGPSTFEAKQRRACMAALEVCAKALSQQHFDTFVTSIRRTPERQTMSQIKDTTTRMLKG